MEMIMEITDSCCDADLSNWFLLWLWSRRSDFVVVVEYANRFMNLVKRLLQLRNLVETSSSYHLMSFQWLRHWPLRKIVLEKLFLMFMPKSLFVKFGASAPDTFDSVSINDYFWFSLHKENKWLSVSWQGSSFHLD